MDALWLPLIGTFPWLLGIAWFVRRGIRDDSEPPSLAESAQTRLWTSG